MYCNPRRLWVTAAHTEYRVLPCMHGVALVPTWEVADRISVAGVAGPEQGAPLLPGGLTEDRLLEHEPYLPALITLSEQDLQFLDATRPEHFAFTHFGPPEQDKDSNQDFALAGRLPGKDGLGDTSFAIIADGISNGYALAQRGAILSCFAAFEVIKETWAETCRTRRAIDSEDVAFFRDRLAEVIRIYFDADRTHILNTSIHPPKNIPQDIWRDRFRDRRSTWYGNTLALAFMSQLGGIIAFIGDGGVILIRGDATNPVEIQRSPEENVLDSFIDADLEGTSIKAAAVRAAPETPYTEIILATDGVDRTFQMNDRSLVDLFARDIPLDETRRILSDFKGAFSDPIDIDNVSLARLLFYTDAPPADRLASADTPVGSDLGTGGADTDEDARMIDRVIRTLAAEPDTQPGPQGADSDTGPSPAHAADTGNQAPVSGSSGRQKTDPATPKDAASSGTHSDMTDHEDTVVVRPKKKPPDVY